MQRPRLDNWQNIQDSPIGLSDGTVPKLAACFVIAVYHYMDIYISQKFLLEEAKKHSSLMTAARTGTIRQLHHAFCLVAGEAMRANLAVCAAEGISGEELSAGFP